MIQDYFNSLVCVNKFSEGSDPDFEPSFALQDEFYCLLDKTAGSRIWQEQGASVKIDINMYCDSNTAITEKDRVKVIDDHILAVADLAGYHKTIGGTWTLTASAAIGTACIFYQASTNTGTDRKADGQEYTVYPPIKNPNGMNRHLELLLQRA
jgi:hypothetical protein